MAKIYLAGKITDNPNYRHIFKCYEDQFTEDGHKIMNPAILPAGFDYEDYMKVCYAMIDICEEVRFLPNWKESPGACREHFYAQATRKTICYI